MSIGKTYKGVSTVRKAGERDLVKKVLLIDKEVDAETSKALRESMQELAYLEQAVLNHSGNGTSYETVAKMLEVPVRYVKYQEKKAIRHLRCPRRYYRILKGDAIYQATKDEHYGEVMVTSCGFTTKTANILKRNGFFYINELEDYIDNVPERFAYIEGLGKFGASEILYYYMERSS